MWEISRGNICDSADGLCLKVSVTRKNTAQISVTKGPISRHCQSIELTPIKPAHIKVFIFLRGIDAIFIVFPFILQFSASSEHAWRRAAANKRAHHRGLHWDVCWQVVKAACFPPLKRRLWNVPVRVRLQQEGVRRHPLCIGDTHTSTDAQHGRSSSGKVIYTDATHTTYDTVLSALSNFALLNYYTHWKQ